MCWASFQQLLRYSEVDLMAAQEEKPGFDHQIVVETDDIDIHEGAGVAGQA